jgi:hypothetical protein
MQYWNFGIEDSIPAVFILNKISSFSLQVIFIILTYKFHEKWRILLIHFISEKMSFLCYTTDIALYPLCRINITNLKPRILSHMLVDSEGF